MFTHEKYKYEPFSEVGVGKEFFKELSLPSEEYEDYVGFYKC